MITAPTSLSASTDAAADDILDFRRLCGVLAAMNGEAIDWLRQTLCGLRGHAMMLHFESTRLSLHCANCGRTTPGWAIQAGRQNVRAA